MTLLNHILWELYYTAQLMGSECSTIVQLIVAGELFPSGTYSYMLDNPRISLDQYVQFDYQLD